jgi:S1-C subfamily serine protease
MRSRNRCCGPARRDDGRTALYRVVGAQVLRLLADESDRDQGERARVAAWWPAQAARFDPVLVLAMGEPASPGIFIR